MRGASAASLRLFLFTLMLAIAGYGCPAAEPSAASLERAPVVETSSIAAEVWTDRLRSLAAVPLDDAYRPDGDLVLLESLQNPDGPTVFAFWATYCPPCLEEMPMFAGLAKSGLRVVGVSLDAERYDAVAETLTTHGARYRQCVLTTEAMKAAGLALDRGLPFTVVVGAAGEVLAAHHGKVDRRWVLAATDDAR